MNNSRSLIAALALVACTGPEGPGGGSAPGPNNANNNGGGDMVAPQDAGPLAPGDLDGSCTVDAPHPRRILRLSPGELLQSYAMLAPVDPAAVPPSLQVGPLPEHPETGLAVTRDFHTDADKLATRLADAYAPALSCNADSFGTDAACTDAFLASEGVRLLRGKSDPEMRSALTALAAEVAQRSGGSSALKYTLRALLLSPASLYMTEGIDAPPDANKQRKLSPVELASYLSFRIFSAPPSAGLLAKLEAMPSPTAQGLRDIIATELSGSSSELSGRFLTTWLQIADIARLSRDREKHPQADASFIQGLEAETLQAVVDVAWDDSATFATLLTKPYQSQLLGDAGSPAAQRWDRPGVLALPGVIAQMSSANHTNIPRRGRFLVKKLFCESLPAPPPGATGQEPPGMLNEPERARFERVGQVAGCGGCHSRLHPLAFAFEAYDELGAARDADEHGNAVNAASEFQVDADTALSFDGPAQMTQVIAQDSTAQNCFVLHGFRHVARRDERGASDGCLIKGLAESARASDFKLAELMTSTLVATALAPRAE